ncbi:cupin-like domain-containing protein [Pseudomonas fluorescens]|uniref:JmjC domain-containing protein n=1 Tax=Pseudomonas fluorescens TaxID=294 RepID=A0A423MAG1_PSEFL|nr:cupin-like domain-containing protein [Pseudomonas fluorescens]RON79786.1 hypothetical protein BK670_20015 [Pseudomonas fluorescens]
MQDISRLVSPSLEEFYFSCVIKNNPALMSGLGETCGALNHWSFDFFSRKYGERIVSATDSAGVTHRISMSDLIQGLKDEHSAGLYLRSLKITSLDSGLLSDIPLLPHFSFDLLQGAESTRDFLKEIFIGPVGSGTRLHADLWHSHSWMLLVAGLKEWTLVSPSELLKAGLEKKVRLKSFVDNLDSELKEVEYFKFLQKPGEFVYVPSGWWHSVRNVECSIGVSFNFVDANSLPAAYAGTQERASMFDELLEKAVGALEQKKAQTELSRVELHMRSKYLSFVNSRIEALENKRVELYGLREILAR